MSSIWQDPDDVHCRPCAFRRYMPDNSIEKTFLIHGEFHLVGGSKKLGELVVRQTPNAILVTVALEPE